MVEILNRINFEHLYTEFKKYTHFLTTCPFLILSAVYGITTGFGKFARTVIPKDDLVWVPPCF